MDKQQVLALFEESGVLKKGHFLLTSGRHSDQYLQCATIFQYAHHSETLCQALAQRVKELDIGLVIGPALGAVQMAYEMGRQLGVRNYFCERVEGKMVLRRGFEITPGTRVLVVEDVITTGGSVREVLALVEAAGGIPVSVGCIVDRTAGKIDFGVPLEAVISVHVDSYEAEDCPQCKAGQGPATKPGSRVF